jgi:hypothetical protein
LQTRIEKAECVLFFDHRFSRDAVTQLQSVTTNSQAMKQRGSLCKIDVQTFPWLSVIAAAARTMARRVAA